MIETTGDALVFRLSLWVAGSVILGVGAWRLGEWLILGRRRK